ncbi:MAG: hypothetical protein DRN78_02080 [Thermoproteota archaeon]|nr:MAG: hypothetical protein DRN78_02080 [Candidatus Korarchaeota archaeon]
MKTESLLGIIFIAVILTSMLLSLVPSTIKPVENTVKASGNEKISSVIINVKTGGVRLIVNKTIDGWFINGTYSGEGEYKLSQDKSYLIMNFDTAIMEVIVGKSVKNIAVFIDTGFLHCIVYKDNISMTISINNGNTNLLCVSDNISLSLSISNGNLDANIITNNITGDIRIKNGNADINGVLSGGRINYKVINGKANVVSMGFTHKSREISNGVEGELFSNGASDLSIYLEDGNLDLLIARK